MTPTAPTIIDTPTAKGRTTLIYVGLLWVVMAIALLIYQFVQPPTINIVWETATEVNTAGYYLYRAPSASADFVRITDELIMAEGTAVSGATYSFIDDNVVMGETYFYLLEEVENDSTVKQYEEDIFTHKVPRTQQMILFLGVICLLLGGVLLGKGIQEKRKNDA